MKLGDIVKGMLAPTILVSEGEHWIRVTTPIGVVQACDLSVARHPLWTPTTVKIHSTTVGRIGFAFWREPARKLRRVA